MNTTDYSRLLVVTYEFPPTGGGGVQRVSRFCRDLREYGWEPTVVTAEHIDGRPLDPSLIEGLESVDVVRLPHRNTIHAVAKRLAPFKRKRSGGGVSQRGGSSDLATRGKKVPLSSRIARWISVPDEAARWGRSVATAVASMDTSFDAVFASGPPHSSLVAGRDCAQALGIPFIADVRDAWSSNPNMDYPTRLHHHLARRHQKRVCESASLVVAVSTPIAEEARALGAVATVVIPNGFDRSEMPELTPDPAGPLRLAFMGRFYGLTDPAPLLDALALIGSAEDSPDIRFDIVGSCDDSIRDAVESRGLSELVTFHGYLPHDEALKVVAGADMGTVIIAEEPGAESVYTGKLFEYLGMGIPVLVIGPVDGVAAVLVRDIHAGTTVAYSSPREIAAAIRDSAEIKSQGAPLANTDAASLKRFERAEQARELSEMLKTIVGESK